MSILGNTSIVLTKTCRVCNATKNLSNFHKDCTKKLGVTTICKECVHINNSTENARIRYRKRNALYKDKEPRCSMYWGSKHRAKVLKVPFTIVMEDIFIPKQCPVFGTDFVFNVLNDDNSPTLDRIIPAIGYVPGNIAVISRRANRIKSNATIEELESLVSFLKSFLNIECVQPVISGSNNAEITGINSTEYGGRLKGFSLT